MENMGNYELIYPVQEQELKEKYDEYLIGAKDVWEDFTTGRKRPTIIDKGQTTVTQGKVAPASPTKTFIQRNPGKVDAGGTCKWENSLRSTSSPPKSYSLSVPKSPVKKQSSDLFSPGLKQPPQKQLSLALDPTLNSTVPHTLLTQNNVPGVLHIGGRKPSVSSSQDQRNGMFKTQIVSQVSTASEIKELEGMNTAGSDLLPPVIAPPLHQPVLKSYDNNPVQNEAVKDSFPGIEKVAYYKNTLFKKQNQQLTEPFMASRVFSRGISEQRQGQSLQHQRRSHQSSKNSVIPDIVRKQVSPKLMEFSPDFGLTVRQVGNQQNNIHGQRRGVFGQKMISNNTSVNV